jgi:hypothetical protein
LNKAEITLHELITSVDDTCERVGFDAGFFFFHFISLLNYPHSEKAGISTSAVDASCRVEAKECSRQSFASR